MNLLDQLKGGLNVDSFVKVVIAAIEDHKITADEFVELQHSFGKLNAEEQDTLSRELVNTRIFQANNLSQSTLQNVLARGTYEEFLRTSPSKPARCAEGRGDASAPASWRSGR